MSNPVSDLVIGLIRERGVILGSQLGAVIRKQFPEFTFRPKYDGVGGFVQVECGDQVAIEKTPSDFRFIYAPVGEATVGRQMEPPKREPPSAWLMFTNPRIEGRLYVNRISGLLESILEGEPTDVENALELSKLRESDYREICEAYVNKLPEGDRPQLAAVIQKPGFWDEWFKVIRTFGEGRYYPDWVQHRIEMIYSKLRIKLTELGLTDELIESTITKLRGVQVEERAAKKQSASPRSFPVSSSYVVNRSLRDMAHSAINLMSDDQIRKLRIPIGILFDVSTNRRG